LRRAACALRCAGDALADGDYVLGN